MTKKSMCIGILFLLAAGISTIGGFSLKAITYIHAPLVHVVVETSDPEALAEDFSNRGFDVAGWDTKAFTLDLILNQDELKTIERENFKILSYEYGQPFSEMITEEKKTLSFSTFPSNYKNLDEIIAEMNRIAVAHPSIAAVVDLTTHLGTPKTAEGRHLYAMKISDYAGLSYPCP